MKEKMEAVDINGKVLKPGDSVLMSRPDGQGLLQKGVIRRMTDKKLYVHYYLPDVDDNGNPTVIVAQNKRRLVEISMAPVCLMKIPKVKQLYTH